MHLRAHSSSRLLLAVPLASFLPCLPFLPFPPFLPCLPCLPLPPYVR
jgi:hypothetical protein